MNCQSHLYRGHDPKLITRRWFFEQCGVGLGAIALGTLFRQQGWAASSMDNLLAAKKPHFEPRPSVSSTCLWRGRQATSNSSITNRN